MLETILQANEFSKMESIKLEQVNEFKDSFKHYLQHTETDSETEKYIEVVFDIKKNSFKIVLINFQIPSKKVLKYNVIKQFNKDNEYVNHETLKQKLTKIQIEEFKKYLKT